MLGVGTLRGEKAPCSVLTWMRRLMWACAQGDIWGRGNLSLSLSPLPTGVSSALPGTFLAQEG